MSSETLRNWLKQDRIDQGELEGLTTTEPEELRRLRREVAELRLERDLLDQETFGAGLFEPGRL